MILQEKEKYNHTIGGVSTPTPSPIWRPDGQPASPAGLPACPPDLQGGEERGFYSFLDSDFEAIEAQEIPESPRLVIRGAQTTPPPPKYNRTVIDYFAFTSKERVHTLIEFINILIPNAIFFPRGKGWQGYKNHASITLFGQTIGMIAYDGNNNRPYLSLSGEGCRKIQNWALVSHYLKLLDTVKISRVDIAADYFLGEITKLCVDNAYAQGKFKLPKSRISPLWDPRNPTGGNDTPKGWTRYIGKRENGKYARIYHKGVEQYGKLDEETQEKFLKVWEDISVDDKYNPPKNATYKDWVRVEIEYYSKNRILPIEILEDRDEYFAGAFPYFEEILPMANPIRPKTLPNTYETDKEIMFNNIRNQYGSFLTSMLSSGMSPEEILSKCVNGKQSQRMFKSGGLEFIKPYDPSVLSPKGEQGCDSKP